MEFNHCPWTALFKTLGTSHPGERHGCDARDAGVAGLLFYDLSSPICLILPHSCSNWHDSRVIRLRSYDHAGCPGIMPVALQKESLWSQSTHVRLGSVVMWSLSGGREGSEWSHSEFEDVFILVSKK